MLSCDDYRTAYQALYAAMRNYVWGVDVVEALANLEVAVYDAFVDVETTKKYFDRVDRAIRSLDVDKDDEELSAALDDFSDLLEEQAEQYHPLYKVNEVVEEDML